MEAVRYAIIDGAIEDELLNFLAAHTPPHCCLYSPPVQPELAELAPYLVQLTPEVEEWLRSRTTPWGIILFSDHSLHKLLQHLRRYLWVKIPKQEKPVLLRFYDPRNIEAFLGVLTPLELSEFTGPISKIVTEYDDISRVENLESAHAVAVNAGSVMKTLTLTTSQYEKLNKLTQINYINKLADFIQDYNVAEAAYPKAERAVIYQQAEDYFLFCQEFNITDNRSIRGITLALLKKGITDTADIPDQWEALLNDSGQSIYYQVETLLLQELGYIPE